jgi:nicotinamide-nucleotide amidase
MSYTAEIIAVGTELLLGSIANTDAQDVSRALSELGINVFFHTVVGDNPARLKNAVDIAKSRADIIITTGGLGPTFDDLTKQTLADAFGKRLIFDETEAAKIRGFFASRHSAEMTENNLRQAYLPEGCTVFTNGCGTAPGCAFTSDGKHVLMLPGPPRECRAMLWDCAVPYLKSLSDAQIFSHNIHIFGMGESAVESRLHDMMETLTNPTLAPYAKESEVLLRLTAKAPTQSEAEALMTPVLSRVRETLGDIIYGVDTDSLENTVVTLLREAGKTVAAAESCTGGLFAKRVTDIPGASNVFPGGIVTYGARAKIDILGVPRSTIENHGVVSYDTAVEMAQRVREKFGADFGVGTTGVAGPGPDDTGVEAGTVFVALASDSGTVCRELKLTGERDRTRTSAVSAALDMLRRHLTGVLELTP